MAKLYNLARVSTATTGTGVITLGAAVSGWLSFANAGVADGELVCYAIRDGSNSEIGHGTYASSGTTLTRTTILKSTNSNAAISLSGSAQVFITPAAEDIAITAADMEIGPYAPPTGSWFDIATAKNAALTTTLTDVSGRGLQVAVTGTNGNDQSALCLRSTSGWGTSYTVTARIVPANRTGSFPTVGLCAYDSSNGKFVIVGSEHNSTAINVLVQRRTNVSTFSSNQQQQSGSEHPTWHRIARATTNLTYSVSWDGLNWFDFTESATAFLAAVPTHIGLAFVGGNTSPPFGSKLCGGLVTYYDDPDHAASAIQKHIAATV